MKRSTLTDGRGVPLSVAIAEANVHDQKLVAETLGNLTVRRPRRHRRRQHLCADKGYDAKAVRTSAARRGYVVHIPRKGGDAPRWHGKHASARRWVVERTHSWLHRFRRILVRWEKRADTYLAMLHLACALITWRAVSRGA